MCIRDRDLAAQGRARRRGPMTLPAIMTGAARVTQPPSRLPPELDPRGPGRSRPTRGSTGARARPGIARWLRWTAGGSALAVALVLVGGFAAYQYYNGRLGHVSIRLPGQAAPAKSRVSDPTMRKSWAGPSLSAGAAWPGRRIETWRSRPPGRAQRPARSRRRSSATSARFPVELGRRSTRAGLADRDQPAGRARAASSTVVGSCLLYTSPSP